MKLRPQKVKGLVFLALLLSSASNAMNLDTLFRTQVTLDELPQAMRECIASSKNARSFNRDQLDISCISLPSVGYEFMSQDDPAKLFDVIMMIRTTGYE